VVSGAQTGADQAGLFVAKKFGYETGGWIPKGFITSDGPRPDFKQEYGIKEHTSDSYVPRTYANARDSDGTIRIAGNLSSRGEICTLNAIKQFKKPRFDVKLNSKNPPTPEDFVAWLDENNIETLNVAGNTESTYPGTFKEASDFLTRAFEILKERHDSESKTIKQSDGD
jgi:hypothetical protein